MCYSGISILTNQRYIKFHQKCMYKKSNRNLNMGHKQDIHKWRNRNSQSVQFSSVAQSCPTLRDPVNHSMPGLPVYHHLLEFTQTHIYWVGDPAISSSVIPFSSCPQTLPASESFPMSQLFTWGGQNTGVSALASISSEEHPGLISCRMDWLDLLAVQGTLKSLLQHHSSKASILCSAFFTVQLSHPYMTTGKTIALTE